MKIYLLTFIENSEKSRVYDDLLCWLRASMISWHAYPEKLEYSLFDDIYTNYSMAYPNGQVIAQTHELHNIQQRLSMIKIKNTYTKVLVAGRKGWQAIKQQPNCKHVRYHWLGLSLPEDWLSVSNCIFYVPEYVLAGEHNTDNMSNVIALPCIPGKKSYIGATLLTTNITELKGDHHQLCYIDECSTNHTSGIYSAINDSSLELLARTIDQQYINEAESKEDTDVDDHEQSAAIELNQINSIMLENITAKKTNIKEPTMKMIQRVPPDYYTHSTLDPKNYFRQCTDFTNSESKWLVLPSTSMSCISEVITRDDLIACRKRIWVVLNRDHKLINEDWVIKQHNNGYFNLAIIKDGQYTLKTAPYNHNIKAVENTKKMTLIWDNEINNANATSELTRVSLFKKLFCCTKSSYKKIMPQPNTASTNTNNSNKKW